MIETGKNWKWSVKGKKILKYKVANKKIIISPKSSSSVNKILGAFAVTGVFALVIKLFGLTQNNAGTNSNYATDYDMELSKVASDAVGSGANSGAGIAQAVQTAQISNVWIWFLLGGIVALVIFMILNWRKLE